MSLRNFCFTAALAVCLSQLYGINAQTEELKPCGDAFYLPSEYTCYEDFLCPYVDGEPTLRCGLDCYSPFMYSCDGDRLVYPSESSRNPEGSTGSCNREPTRFELREAPYTNYFYSDCNSASQVVVTSPLPSNNLTVIGPRLLIAWPAGNSGIVTYFEPQNGVNGSLSIALVNSTETGNALEPIYEEQGDDHPIVGVSGLIKFNSSATLTVPILGSIRTIRDFSEGPSLLQDIIQDANNFSETAVGGATVDRLWLDNVTTTSLSFSPTDDEGSVTVYGRNLSFEAGTYMFNASFNYPQLTQLSVQDTLAETAQDLATTQLSTVEALSFLSYTDKLLAGAWRFLTYFGRDSAISMLLMESILSPGKNGSFEAGISALLERIEKSTGSAAHEETIGDYATWLNLQDNVTSTDPVYDYKMIDTDYYVPVILADYFIKNEVGRTRAKDLLATKATVNPKNKGLTYQELAQLNAEKIMNATAAFAAPGGQTEDNLIHLLKDDLVGEWRDSTYGIGGGRIPYDVNTGIVPAGLRAVAALAEAGYFPDHPDWAEQASTFAQVWEDKTLQFFEIQIPESEARDLVDDYVQENDFPFPSNSDNITEDVTFYGLALNGNNDQKIVRVLNTDDCFRHFLLNTTNQTQLTDYLSQTAGHILTPFPAGLMSDVGLFVANPAYGNNSVYSRNFTNSAYHGTVVWSWQLAMMAAGLERQLGRCQGDNSSTPDFCTNEAVYQKVLRAYNHLWDVLEENRQLLSLEVWSWKYEDDRFSAISLGELPPPPGVGPTESNIRQLWSLTFLAVTRNENLRQ